MSKERKPSTAQAQEATPAQEAQGVIQVEVGTLDGPITAAHLDRAAIDVQVATAKQYPRSVDRSLKDAITLACDSEEVAESMWYVIPRGGKDITAILQVSFRIKIVLAAPSPDRIGAGGRSRSSRSFSIATNRQDGAGGVPNDAFGRAAHEDMFQAGVAMGRNHHHVGLEFLGCDRDLVEGLAQAHDRFCQVRRRHILTAPLLELLAHG